MPLCCCSTGGRVQGATALRKHTWSLQKVVETPSLPSTEHFSARRPGLPVPATGRLIDSDTPPPCKLRVADTVLVTSTSITTIVGSMLRLCGKFIPTTMRTNNRPGNFQQRLLNEKLTAQFNVEWPYATVEKPKVML
jgi:hypothetical protein